MSTKDWGSDAGPFYRDPFKCGYKAPQAPERMGPVTQGKKTHKPSPEENEEAKKAFYEFMEVCILQHPLYRYINPYTRIYLWMGGS